MDGQRRLRVVREDEGLEQAINTLETWPRVQGYCLSLTTYAAQNREAFGQRPSFMSSNERAIARNGYEVLVAEAQAEFPKASPEARYISDLAGRLVASYSGGYGFK